MEITGNTIIIRKDDFISSEIDNQTVMMSVETSKYYGFDEIGSVIWAKIENEISFGDLVNKLLEEYNIDREVCEKDTTEFLEKLVKMKLIDVKS